MVAAVRKLQLPPLPADPIGAKFCHWFNHGWNYIIAPIPDTVEKPAWRTETAYPLQPRNLWDFYNHPDVLLGLRFANQTNYTLIDIDRGSTYHPANNLENYQKILIAAESIGLCRKVAVQSSFSQGIHLYFFLPHPVSSIQLACAFKYALLDLGCSLKSGQLEIFPNVKAYKKSGYSNYNAHKLPLQPHSGSLLLDEEFQPISADLTGFLNAADWSASGQDIELLEKSLTPAYNRQKSAYNFAGGNRGQIWKAHLETRFLQGWTDSGQTNELLKDIGIYGRVFVRLDSIDSLAQYIYTTAMSRPGYREFCHHQDEIEKRSHSWASTIFDYYSPYCSRPDRHGTYKDYFRREDSTPHYQDNPTNSDRRTQAQNRIKQAVTALEAEGLLPPQVGHRATAIMFKSKELSGIAVSRNTLFKKSYLHLWHPAHYNQVWDESSPEIVVAISNGVNLGTKTSSVLLINPAKPSPNKDLGNCPTPPVYMKVSESVAGLDALQAQSESSRTFLSLQGALEVFDASPDVNLNVLPEVLFERIDAPELMISSATAFPEDKVYSVEVLSEPIDTLNQISNPTAFDNSQTANQTPINQDKFPSTSPPLFVLIQLKRLAWKNHKYRYQIRKWVSETNGVGFDAQGYPCLIAEIVSTDKENSGLSQAANDNSNLTLIDNSYLSRTADASLMRSESQDNLSEEVPILESSKVSKLSEEHIATQVEAEVQPPMLEDDIATLDENPSLNLFEPDKDECVSPSPLNFESTSSTETNLIDPINPQGLKVGDKVFVTDCPSHWDSWSPFEILSVEGLYAKLELISQLILLSRLRLAT